MNNYFFHSEGFSFSHPDGPSGNLKGKQSQFRFQGSHSDYQPLNKKYYKFLEGQLSIIGEHGDYVKKYCVLRNDSIVFFSKIEDYISKPLSPEHKINLIEYTFHIDQLYNKQKVIDSRKDDIYLMNIIPPASKGFQRKQLVLKFNNEETMTLWKNSIHTNKELELERSSSRVDYSLKASEMRDKTFASVCTQIIQKNKRVNPIFSASPIHSPIKFDSLDTFDLSRSFDDEKEKPSPGNSSTSRGNKNLAISIHKEEKSSSGNSTTNKENKYLAIKNKIAFDFSNLNSKHAVPSENKSSVTSSTISYKQEKDSQIKNNSEIIERIYCEEGEDCSLIFNFDAIKVIKTNQEVSSQLQLLRENFESILSLNFNEANLKQLIEKEGMRENCELQTDALFAVHDLINNILSVRYSAPLLKKVLILLDELFLKFVGIVEQVCKAVIKDVKSCRSHRHILLAKIIFNETRLFCEYYISYKNRTRQLLNETCRIFSLRQSYFGKSRLNHLTRSEGRLADDEVEDKRALMNISIYSAQLLYFLKVYR